MSKEIKLLPELRFSEFAKDGEWEMKSLDKIVDDFIVPMRDKPKQLDGEIPWCRIEDFNGMYLSSSKSNQGVSWKTIKEMNLKVYPINTLLVSCSADLGRCAITQKELVTNQTFIGLVPNTRKIDTVYLYYMMINSRNELNARSSGTTISYLSRQEFEKFKIALPRLTEQQRIASCLSSLDELITVHNNKLETLKDHKKGLMQNLFPQEGQKIPNYRFKEFEKDGEWMKKKLGDEGVSYFVNEKINSKSLTLDSYISTSNMLPDYSGIETATKLPTTIRVTEFIEGDILVSNIRPYLKKVWKSDRRGGASNDVLVFRTGSKVISEFLEFILKNDDFINYVMKSVKGVKMPRGDKKSMLKYPVKIPSESEQQKIASCLSALDELITAETERIEQLLEHKKGLMQGLFPKIKS